MRGRSRSIWKSIISSSPLYRKSWSMIFRKNLCVSFFPMPIRFNGPLPSRKSIPFWQTKKWQSCCTLLSAVRCFIYAAYPLIRIIIQGNVSVPIIVQIPTIWRLSLPYNRRFVHEADTDFACRLSRYG